jgi:hypothetical protein
VHGAHITVEPAATVQLTQDGRDTAGAVDVFDQIGAVRRDLRQARCLAGDSVDVLEGEVESASWAAASKYRMVLDEPPMDVRDPVSCMPGVCLET